MATTINGGTGIDKVQDAVVTDGKLNLSANSQAIKDALNAGGNAPIYACRAWVNFDGTGTVAIRASGNVSSVTDNGTGNYTVNFATSLPDVNYSISFFVNDDNNLGAGVLSKYSSDIQSESSSQFRVFRSGSEAAVDVSLITISFIR